VRGLYWKLFVWFWVMILLTGVATFGLVRWSYEHRSTGDLEAQAEQLARAAEGVWAEGGRPAVHQWLHQMNGDRPDWILVVPEDGSRLPRRLGPAMRAHLALARGASGPVVTRFRHGRLVSAPLGGGSGLRLVVFAPSRPLRPGPLPAIWPVAALGVSAILCLILAWWLTRPIRHLTTVARRLGDGDLAARSGLAGRRDEIGRLGRALDEAAGRIQVLLASHRRLVSDVSHELRSPLARLKVAVELARSRGHGGTELARIETEADRLEEMIAELLMLSRIEAGEVSGLDQAFDLAAMVRDVIHDAEFEFAGSGRRVNAPSLPEACRMQGHETLLRSAFENVLRNALRYTSDAGAEVGLSCEGGTILLTVRDHGPGVPESDLGRLFEPFYRVSEARDRDSGGFGLGLAIAARAVAMHGGGIRAENAPAGGLQVTVTLPASPAGGRGASA
jgi:two-component system sensor histidine kinase CpxA